MQVVGEIVRQPASYPTESTRRNCQGSCRLSGKQLPKSSDATTLIVKPKIGAEIGERVALNLGESHLQQNLLASPEGEQIGHRARRIALGNGENLTQAVGARNLPAQYQGVARRLNGYLFFRKNVRKAALQRIAIEGDENIDHGNDVAGLIRDSEIGRAAFLAQHIDQIPRQRHDIGNVFVADRDFSEALIDVDQLRLVDRNAELTRCLLALKIDQRRGRRNIGQSRYGCLRRLSGERQRRQNQAGHQNETSHVDCPRPIRL